MELGGFGTDAAHKKAMWEEATREALQMMVQTPYGGVDGEYVQMPARNVIPKPLQKPHPPVWVAASRRETVMVAGRLGIGSLGFGFETPAEAEERIGSYWDLIRDECIPIGEAINPAVATVGNLHCAPTDEEAIEQGAEGAAFFGYAIGRNGPPAAPRRPGLDHINREFAERQAAATPVPELEAEDESARTLQRAGARGRFIGSPDFIRENLRAYETAHLDALIFIAQCGSRRHEDIMSSIELFAKEVMPEFKERHVEHQRWREQQLEGVDLVVNSTI
jgi:alkanesulfonate monooxygenase SsuD/methylene tetrahydromethanopterin reductase-like flavin-dependent oxidoreductase (luciferase family)